MKMVYCIIVKEVRSFYYTDIVHSTQLGHNIIADFVFNKIKSINNDIRYSHGNVFTPVEEIHDNSEIIVE